MRVAALYDIHANLPALEAVLADVEAAAPDLIVVGGDVVPGPMPAATLDALFDLSVETLFIHGNGERDVLAYMSGVIPVRVPERFRPTVRWTAERISDAHREAMAGWPLVARATVPGRGDVLFCHATSRSDNEIITKNTPESVLTRLFDGTGASLVVCGHTHMQFDLVAGGSRIINAGSVGMAFGENAACWLLLDDEPQLRRTRYDVESAARRIAATDCPDAAGFAEQFVLRSPAESEMLAMFDRVAVVEP
jgi:predicted phosphodiesterase